VQVRQDLSSGRLVSPLSTVCLLSSYAVQSTLGDYDLDSCRPGYLANFAALRHHCKEICCQILDIGIFTSVLRIHDILV
jgi:hypothetical protein